MTGKPDRRASRRRPRAGAGGRPAPRQRQPKGRSRVGERFEVEVGPVAHGGHCVARVEDRVIFVRHTLPGERVVVEVTEGTEGDRFWRGDAVTVLEAAAERRTPPCPVAGPGGCGGCDFQHVSLQHQRELKASVVREQLARLARLDVPVLVEAVPGDQEGLHWRTRMRYVDLGEGRRGMRKHRSQDVVEIDRCLIAHPRARVHGEQGGTVTEEVGPHEFAVAADGFWQVHPGAPSALVEAVLSGLEPQVGESVLDLYSGVGLIARFLADAVGPTGRVASIEGDRTASGHAAENLAGLPGVEVTRGDVATVLGKSHPGAWDLVVLDPPREGARRAVVEQVAARRPRAVAYVACDPAALARDVAIFAEHGYGLSGLRAFDLFPMTHHVECVALLTKTSSDLR